jgi:hypothetical protein
MTDGFLSMCQLNCPFPLTLAWLDGGDLTKLSEARNSQVLLLLRNSRSTNHGYKKRRLRLPFLLGNENEQERSCLVNAS